EAVAIVRQRTMSTKNSITFPLAVTSGAEPWMVLHHRTSTNNFKLYSTARVAHIMVGLVAFFFSSRSRHTRLVSDWSSDVCSSDLRPCQWQHHRRGEPGLSGHWQGRVRQLLRRDRLHRLHHRPGRLLHHHRSQDLHRHQDRKSVV